MPEKLHLLSCAFSSKDNDLLDKRKHCFSVQTETGEDLFFSVELDCELLIWEKAFQMATFLEVERIQVCCTGRWGGGGGGGVRRVGNWDDFSQARHSSVVGYKD